MRRTGRKNDCIPKELMSTVNQHSNSESPVGKDEAKRLLNAATLAAVMTALFLVVTKAIAWLLTGSVALLGSLLDSLLDTFASLLNFFAVRHALTPRDAEHRFGHGKAEALAGLGQSLLISVSALFLLWESFNHFLEPQSVAFGAIGIAVIVLAIGLTLALVKFQRHVIQKTGSLAISADELHYKGDLLMNAAVIVALLVSGFTPLTWADPLIGIGIGLYILSSAWQIVVRSFDQLMDREFDDEKRFRVLALARNHPQVRSVHDVRTRSAGTWDFIQMHIELDPSMSLIQAHEIADEVELSLKSEFPRAEIIIHQDPAGIEELSPLDRN